ncbi:MAG: helix-turn-helix domain-containing protein [Fibromonadales bacterium]|nr:helix-turn-helix domain-containing protein [Fibromonadales bacterium]
MLKKLVTIILALIALLAGFYALVRFAGLDPDEFFSKPAKKAEVYATASPEKLQQLHDSLETINFVIRRETNEILLKNLKDTQKSLWERILATQNAIVKAEAPKSIKEEETDLVDSLIKGISITAAVLLVIIVFLIVKIMRRSKEVEKVTERLMVLQTEPAPPPPLGNIDPTIFQSRYRPSPLPQVQPAEMPEQEPSQPEHPKLRKTAKQRVTEAVQKMKDALASLRGQGTKKTQAMTGPIAATQKITKTNIRVPSLNTTIIPPSQDETTYDRRAREKKQILDYAKQGRTPAEIAKWLSLPRDQVETTIRLARERGE